MAQIYILITKSHVDVDSSNRKIRLTPKTTKKSIQKISEESFSLLLHLPPCQISVSTPPPPPHPHHPNSALPHCAVSSRCERSNVNVWRHLTSPLAFRAQPNHSGPKPIGNSNGKTKQSLWEPVGICWADRGKVCSRSKALNRSERSQI